MNKRTQLFSLKSIKIGFDIVFVVLILLTLLLIFASVVEMAYLSPKTNNSSILARIVPLDNTYNNITLISKIDNSSTKGSIDASDIAIKMDRTNFKSLPILYRIISTLTLVLGLLFLIFVVFHIKNIIKCIIRGTREENSYKHFVFNKENIKRFRYIGIGFICMPIIELTIYLFDNYFLKKYFYIPDYKILPSSSLGYITWDYIFIGLLFITFIEIIRRGISIQEENDLTV
ncbi:MAG: DUF2975 domain-containing protein [Bacteroidales bacterium]|nr:DUF2975 domain-containing protein [Bacteroidales bacterium]